MTADLKMQQGCAYYAGRQGSQNDATDRPTREYLCSVHQEIVARTRYAGHMGLGDLMGGRIQLVYFVDPETRMLYGQPHPETEAGLLSRWSSLDPELLVFAEGRAFARWLRQDRGVRGANGKEERLETEQHWRDYVAGAFSLLAPPPLSVPAQPHMAYATAGWAGWEDWFMEPSSRAVL
jgi:hypothetical protein